MKHPGKPLALDKQELVTNLVEIEACVNSRPLTFVGDALDSGKVLTPSHFLIGRNSSYQSVPSGSDSVSVKHDDLVLRDQICSQMLDQFWAVWCRNYLCNLAPWRGAKFKDTIKVGSMVLVGDTGAPRLMWPLGKVQRVFPGRDGVVRAAEVKLKSGVVTRPLQKLYKLEIGPDYATNDDTSEARSDALDPPLSMGGAQDRSTPCDALDPPHDMRGAQGMAGHTSPSDIMQPVSVRPESTSVEQNESSQRVSRFGRVINPVKRLVL